MSSDLEFLGLVAELPGRFGTEVHTFVLMDNWRMVEVVKAVGGIEYAAAAQGVRRFWKRAAERKEMAEFAKRLRAALAKCR